MFRKHVSAFVLLLILSAAATAQVNEVNEYIRAEMIRQRIPGVSLAVVKNGKTVLVEGYGLANVELNVSAKADTVFKIGSVSKQFIATGIMLLVQQGKVVLDDKVSKYLEGTPETWNAISVRHLLTHTSGLVREGPGFNPFKVQSDADVIKTAYPLPLRFQPGEKWEYCNVGYFMLAEIIRKVSGKPWEDFLKEQVFLPLAMEATRTTTVAEIIPNRANADIRFSALQPQPPPDPAMTTMFQGLLAEYAQGVKELKQVTPELMAGLAGVQQTNRDELTALLKNAKSFEFLARRDLNGKGLVKLGVPVTTLWIYRLTTTENKTFHYSFYLTQDKRVAQLQVSTI